MGVIYFLKIIFSSPEVTAAMKKVSILNHVIGPVMRGPSSSHTAGPWRIGRMAANLLEAPPDRAVFTFHPSRSLAVCFRDQGCDLAFAAGLLGRPLTDPDFPRILSLAPGQQPPATALTSASRRHLFPKRTIRTVLSSDFREEERN
jgi:iron-sulfur-dependent L-serine dehydratase beta subunit